MTEELVTFETAKLAKEKGFDEECHHSWEWYVVADRPYGPVAHQYTHIDIREFGEETFRMFKERPDLYEKVCGPHRNSDLPSILYARPTQALLERWLREKHGIMAGIFVVERMGKIIGFRRCVIQMDKVDRNAALPRNEYETVEVALEAALQEALKLLPDAMDCQ